MTTTDQVSKKRRSALNSLNGPAGMDRQEFLLSELGIKDSCIIMCINNVETMNQL